MLRIDLILTEQGLAKSRSQAQTFISEGRVSYKQNEKWIKVTKPSLKLSSDIELNVISDEADKYVSRGALKLEGALLHTKLNIEGFLVLDIGQSTGGFSDCAIQHGAAHVVGVEVGHDQLDPRLRNHQNIICLEGINARNLSIKDLSEHFPENGFDLIVMDVSFISQTKILPQLPNLLSKTGHLITLVKPQFEVGKEFIGKGGIVKDKTRVKQLEQDMQDFVTELGFEVKCYIESPIKGGDGNQEFLLWATRS
ncbi:TlyA family RNA methyltransferase [Marinomonas polaris]|uniref:23S rRNA (Cytidine1920-2'-O)/16S rRNA (Cytidine1409-2'-O)-methyltransferase n=1 Tax=Marinomonas polaris DSM 16579 TaxID=1122206 RepID=A0A1M5IKB1_9GAMM|nr:TlyA family RNA methyltransferase [Marinomonas polaris]SHG28717.1 23S rRNA (cytidine1920-2'-O)/16S rRNA (cytidine1409-2'-O)-methyltransferase [Marinomonas polaris DSM 16579]|tara:strand:- start:40496 stop:41254 length:759 start_codon:yes stop_codon:yes gene_type:complete